MKRACADVTLKDGGRRRYVRVSSVVAELNLLSLSEVGSTRPQSGLCYTMKYGVGWRKGVFHPTGDTLAMSPDPDEHEFTLAMSLTALRCYFLFTFLL